MDREQPHRRRDEFRRHSGGVKGDGRSYLSGGAAAGSMVIALKYKNADSS